ncbi:MAG: hypothetical protein F4219_09120 [Gammaproteobacteria bacterium]|nr:hypothetical protein [Gammaproteobacteria bacterium]
MITTVISVSLDSMMYFEGYNQRVNVHKDVAEVWHRHRQTGAKTVESFGVLIGTTSVNRREIWIEMVTTPMSRDQCSRFSFSLLDPGHQKAVCKMFYSTDGRAIYLGTWHTHPESIPEPSNIDKNDWANCLRMNRRRPLAFVLVGIEEIRLFIQRNGRFKSLQENHITM